MKEKSDLLPHEVLIMSFSVSEMLASSSSKSARMFSLMTVFLSSSCNVIHQRFQREMYDIILSPFWRDSTPPCLWPWVQSILASLACRGNIISLIAATSFGTESSSFNLSSPKSFATKNALARKPSMIRLARRQRSSSSDP